MTEPHFPYALALTGPTASGKTGLALALAQRFPCEIISADSRQFYKYLDIGTAKPDPVERSICPHHFIDILEPDESYNAGRFGGEAAAVVEDIIARKKLPLIVGGSGLYISALCDGIFNAGNEDTGGIREELNMRLESEGRDRLYEELTRIDPESAARYPDRNPVRIIRALEYYYSAGERFSEAHRTKKAEPRNFTSFFFALDHSREDLYERINRRSEQMWQSGLVDETRNILDMGYPPGLQSLNTVGYKETIAFLNNEITAGRALELIQQNTRRYAKRQLTWFRRDERIRWLSAATALGEITEFIGKR